MYMDLYLKNYKLMVGKNYKMEICRYSFWLFFVAIETVSKQILLRHTIFMSMCHSKTLFIVNIKSVSYDNL